MSEVAAENRAPTKCEVELITTLATCELIIDAEIWPPLNVPDLDADIGATEVLVFPTRIALLCTVCWPMLMFKANGAVDDTETDGLG